METGGSPMSKTMNFRSDQDLKDLVRRWWGSLQTNRGDRAELSRATSEAKVYESAAFYRFRRLLEDAEYNVYGRALARTAAVLARIRRDRDGESFGILLSRKMRFEDVKPVLKIRHPDRLISRLAAWVGRLSGEAPVVGTADLAYWWEIRHPNREFLYDFFLKETPA
jgi:hypothetical protein